MNIKPCMGHISRTWELLLCEYWRKSMINGEKNTDLKRLTVRLKLRFLTEIGRFHWNQGEEVAHFTWFGEPCHWSQCFPTKTPFWYCTCYWMNLEKQIQMPKYICTTPYTCQNCELRSSDSRLSVSKKSLCLIQGSHWYYSTWWMVLKLSRDGDWLSYNA